MDDIIEYKALNLRDQYREEVKNALMITMMNFRIPFKQYFFNFFNINTAYQYVIFLLELPSNQENPVVYVFR